MHNFEEEKLYFIVEKTHVVQLTYIISVQNAKI